MKRILALLLAAAASVFVAVNARADSTVVSLPAATALVGSSTYLNQAGTGNNQLTFNTILFGLSSGSLTLNSNAITSSLMSPTITAGSCTSCNLTYDVAGRLLVASNGSGGGGGSPGGSNQSVQINSAGTFGGIGPTSGNLLGWNASGVATPIVLGSNLSLSGSTLNATGGSGGISGLTVGQLGVAGSATTLTSSVPFGFTGSGSFIPSTSGGLLSPTVLPVASPSTFGVSECDNSTITCAGGVFSAVTGGGGNVISPGSGFTGGNLIQANNTAGTAILGTSLATANVVTAVPTLTANQLVIGAGSKSVAALGSAGTGTTVLHGNGGGGAPAFSSVVLTTDVSGNLPNVNLTALSANQLLGALTATTPNGITVPGCTDTGGNHLNWTSGTGFSCGNTGGVSTTFTLSPGFASTPGTYNAGAQTVTNGSTLSGQLFYEAHATSYTLAATDGGKLPTFTASGQTATFPAPGAVGSSSYQFGYDGSHSYSITATGGPTIYGCGTAGTTVSGLAYQIQLVSDGSNYQCIPSGAPTGASGFPIILGATSVAANSSNTTLAGLTLTTATLTTPTINGATLSGTLSGAHTVSGAVAQTGVLTTSEVISGIRSYSGATDTLAATDCGYVVHSTGGGGVTETVPNSLPAGCNIAIEQIGSGVVTMSAGAGSTQHSPCATVATNGQYAILQVHTESNAGSAAVYDVVGGCT